MKYYCYSMLNLSNSFYEADDPDDLIEFFKDAPETYTSLSMTDDGQHRFREITYITTSEPEDYFSIIDELPEDAELITPEVLASENPYRR
jgi:hypothetical protein